MNRIVTFGLSGFFALIVICLIDGPKPAKAFNGWQFYGCCGCQGWHPWHSYQRCYSCGGCSGCYGSCCASSHCSGCWSYQSCYGCYGCSCQGAIYHSCHACYGASGYYQPALPAIGVLVESTQSANPPATAPGEKSTSQFVPENGSQSSYFSDENAILIGQSAQSRVLDPYIYQPR